MSSPYLSALRRLGHTRVFARLGRAAVPLDEFLYRRTSGRLTLTGRAVLPQLLLTTTGARSGQPRTVALLYLQHGPDMVLVASNWGQPRHPAWSANLLAEPRATVQVADRTLAVLTRLATDSERAELWPEIVRMWPAYDTYAERSGRTLRVFLARATRP